MSVCCVRVALDPHACVSVDRACHTVLSVPTLPPIHAVELVASWTAQAPRQESSLVLIRVLRCVVHPCSECMHVPLHPSCPCGEPFQLAPVRVCQFFCRFLHENKRLFCCWCCQPRCSFVMSVHAQVGPAVWRSLSADLLKSEVCQLCV